MKRSDVDYLYEWATANEFPLRRAPTAVGYSNKDIYFCWLKALTNNGGGVRESVVEDQRARDILNQEEILVAIFPNGTHSTWNFLGRNPQHLDVTWSFIGRNGPRFAFAFRGWAPARSRMTATKPHHG